MSRRYLLDSGPAQDYLFKRREVAERVRLLRDGGAKVGVCSPILGEVVGGLEGSASRDRSWEAARGLLTTLVLWPYDKAAAYTYGPLAADLRRRGRAMQQIDMQLAAVALALGDCTVVSYDSDLRAIPGLSVEDWSAT